MEAVGIALACISILDISLVRLDAIRKSSKSLGTAVTGARVKMAAIKSFLELWLRAWQHEAYGVVDTRHQIALKNLFSQMSMEIENAELILKKYDPREKYAATVDSRYTISHFIVGTLKPNDGQTSVVKTPTPDQSTSMLKAPKNHTSTAHEVQHNIGWRKKLTWSRSEQKDLAECLAHINQLRSDVVELSNILARNNQIHGQKPQVTGEQAGTVVEKTFEITTRIWKATSSLRKCLPFFQGQATSNVDLILIQNRQTPPKQSLYLLDDTKLSSSSIKFPLYLRDHQSNSTKFALIESSDSIAVMRAVDPSVPEAYEIKVFAQDNYSHTLHTMCIDPTTIKPSISLSTLLEQSSSVTNQSMDMWNRLCIAHLLAVSVLHLQDTGWFNANLHSDCIRLQGPRDSCLSDALSPLLPIVTVLQSITTGDISQSDAEAFRSRTLGTIYKHQFPWAQTHDPGLNKAIHELGLILLEIGIGKPLSMIMAELGDVAGDEATLKTELNKLVAKTKLGKNFREVTGVCLNVHFGFCGTDEGLRVAFLDKVVNRLAQLEAWAGNVEG